MSNYTEEEDVPQERLMVALAEAAEERDKAKAELAQAQAELAKTRSQPEMTVEQAKAAMAALEARLVRGEVIPDYVAQVVGLARKAGANVPIDRHGRWR
jgi:vacuolar-type H+-ATPase subunit E/Vma4